jgi:hypothetical protein
MALVSPTFRSGLSLVLWPFLVMMATFAFDAPIKNVWDGLFRTAFAISMFFYPACFFYGVVLKRSKNEARKERARFWLALPWKVIGFWIVAVIIVAVVMKSFGT